jgi:hypothetical protein
MNGLHDRFSFLNSTCTLDNHRAGFLFPHTRNLAAFVVSKDGGGAMRPFLFSAATCAALVVIVAVSGGLVIFEMLQSHPVYPPHINAARELRGFFSFLILGSSVTGILVWATARVLRRDGSRRLAAIETVVRSKL